MGWDSASHWTTKKIVVDDILRSAGDRIEAHKSTGSGLWYIYRCEDGTRLIVVDLLERSNGGYSRKSVSEDMGPVVIDCPIEFLAMCPVPDSEYAKAWRARVIAGHAFKAQRRAVKSALQVGQVVKLSNGWEMRITSIKPLAGVHLETGRPYTIPTKFLTV